MSAADQIAPEYVQRLKKPNADQQAIEETIRFWKQRARVCELKAAAYQEELREALEAVEALEREWFEAMRE